MSRADNGSGAPEPTGPSQDRSFEERLAAARRKQGLDEPPATGPGGGIQGGGSAMSIGLRVGVEMVAALVVAVAIGWYLDRWLHTKPFLLIVFVFLGGAAGLSNVWRLIAPRGKAGPL